MAVWMRTSKAIAALALLFGMSSVSVLAQPPGTQIPGTVLSITDDVISLADGTSFPITDQTRVTRITRATAADLTPGMYASIAAGRAPDGALQASLVAAVTPSGPPREGQRPLNEIQFCQPGCGPRDLMIDALISEAMFDAVSSGELTISFAGETDQLRITPDTRVEIQNPGSLADVAPGSSVLGFVNPEGVGTGVWVYID